MDDYYTVIYIRAIVLPRSVGQLVAELYEKTSNGLDVASHGRELMKLFRFADSYNIEFHVLIAAQLNFQCISTRVIWDSQ